MDLEFLFDQRLSFNLHIALSVRVTVRSALCCIKSAKELKDPYVMKAIYTFNQINT